MENEKLVITKDNYKGYVELYRTRELLSNKTIDLLKTYCIKTFLSISIGGMFIVLSNFFLPVIAVSMEMLILAIAEISFFVDWRIKETACIKPEEVKMKEKYPYVDIEISDGKLKKILEEAKIFISGNGLDVEGYENYLKCEEEKEKYLEETKYDKYVVNPEIQPEELEKAKEKVKKLVR